MSATSLNYPHDAVTDSNGKLYVADYGNHRALRYDAETPSTTYSISGRVTSNVSNCLSGVTIVATSTTASAIATTDANGNYTVPGLIAGTYTITPSKTGCAFSPPTRTVTLISSNIIGQDFSGGSQVPTKPWTLLFYIAGDSNLDHTYPPALNQLELAANNNNVNIVALWDRIGTNNSAYYLVQYDTDTTKLANYVANVNYWPQGELNLAAPETLSNFMSWATTNYPAQHYALILDDHGSGLGGTLTDDTSSPGSIMPIGNIAAVLASLKLQGIVIDTLYMNSCLMAMIEDAYQLQNTISYYVASEHLQTAWHKPYFGYIAGITGSSSPVDVARIFVNSYADVAEATQQPYTMSAADMSKLSNLVNATNALGRALYGQTSTAAIRIEEVLRDVQRFDVNDDKKLSDNDEYIDLHDFARLVKAKFASSNDVRDAAQSVMDAVSTYIILNRIPRSDSAHAKLNLRNSFGVSVFFPSKPSSFYSGANFSFASGAVWGQRSIQGTQQTGDSWAGMVSNYIQVTQPGALDNPSPPRPQPKLLDPGANGQIVFIPSVRNG